MADAVASQTIQDGPKTAIFRFTNVSDGTGESAVVKVDASALSEDPVTKKACTSVSIECIWYSTIGMGVKIFSMQPPMFWHGSYAPMMRGK